MKNPIIRISAEAQTERAAMAQTFHEVDTAVKGGDAPWLAFDVGSGIAPGGPSMVAPWRHVGVETWVTKAIMAELRTLDGLALEVGREGEIPGLGRLSILVIASRIFPQAPVETYALSMTDAEIRRGGEALVRFEHGVLVCPEATFKRDLRIFCERKGVKVLSAARDISSGRKDGLVGMVEIATDIGPILWRFSPIAQDKHSIRVQLVEVMRLCAAIHRDCTAGATQLAPTDHPSFAAIVANDIRAVRAHL